MYRPSFSPGTARRLVLAGLVAVTAVVAVVLAPRSRTPSSAAALVRQPSAVAQPARPSSIPRSTASRPRHPATAGVADGVVPAGTTVFDDGVPGVARLDPALLAALRRAASDAARAGITVQVNSGWRSRRYQDQLLREAVARYGSEEAAARWVATADTSPHVSGHAVDIGPPDAAAWMSARGVAYGLCPVYRNEPWHFELRPQAVAHGCPPLYANPTQDPRMRR